MHHGMFLQQRRANVIPAWACSSCGAAWSGAMHGGIGVALCSHDATSSCTANVPTRSVDVQPVAQVKRTFASAARCTTGGWAAASALLPSSVTASTLRSAESTYLAKAAICGRGQASVES